MTTKKWPMNLQSLCRFALAPAVLFCLSAAAVQAQTISLNAEIGKIQKIQEGWNGKTLIFIEEAHADYDAQKAIVDVLRAVMSQEALRLILVEGGWDDMSLSDLRVYGTREDREKIAERYLREGKISAEEYLDILGDQELLLRGIENRGLYAGNMSAFLKFHELQAAALLQLDIFRAGLGKLQERIYSKKLKELESRRSGEASGTLSLMAYLPDLARRSGADLNQYPLAHQLSILMGGGTLDLDKVQKEKNELLGALSRRVSKIELEPVRRRLASQKPEDETAVLREALDILGRYPDLERQQDCPNLRTYLAALEKMQSLDFQNLAGEMAALEALAQDRLGLSEDEKTLLDLSRFAERVHKLFKLELGPADWEALKAGLTRWNPETVRRELTRLGPGPESAAALEAVEPLWKNIPAARAFYEAALERENALIENTLREMQSRPDTAAVVITGGFHTSRMLQEIRGHGFTILRATPRFQPKDPEAAQKKYFETLKGRWVSSQAENSKSQIPSTKFQTNSKSQIPSTKQITTEKSEIINSKSETNPKFKIINFKQSAYE